MQPLPNEPRYLVRWSHSRHERLGRDSLATTHRLAESPLFSDLGLAAILDRYPRRALRVTTMGENPAYPSQLQLGRLDQHSGIELVRMIRRGRLRMRMRDVVRHHDGLARTVARLCSEMMECQVGLRTYDHDGDLEISSPSALTYYRYDAKPNVFWQIRGTRNIYLYPSGEPFIHPRELAERAVLGSQEPLYFEPAFDDQAQSLTHLSGEMLSLPQYTPYRIVNGNGLCVSLTTSYWTKECRLRHETHRANQIMSRLLPMAARSAESSGLIAFGKRTLMRLVKTTKVNSTWPSDPTFRVDPDAPLCVASLIAAPDAPLTHEPEQGLRFETTPSTTTALEN